MSNQLALCHFEALSTWQEVWSIVYILNRRSELERLVAWATRKRLTGPRRLYRSRLLDEEIRLSKYTVMSPGYAVTLAYLVHFSNRLVFPPHRYMRRGAAAGYAAKKA